VEKPQIAILAVAAILFVASVFLMVFGQVPSQTLGVTLLEFGILFACFGVLPDIVGYFRKGAKNVEV
jgi:uncharacterized membrane protein